MMYAAATFLAGWKIGGRPPGWYEGKFLLFPFVLLAVFCAVVALAGLVYALVAVRTESKVGGAGWRALGALGLSALASALLIVNAVVPFGLGVAYMVAEWRYEMWFYTR